MMRVGYVDRDGFLRSVATARDGIEAAPEFSGCKKIPVDNDIPPAPGRGWKFNAERWAWVISDAERHSQGVAAIKESRARLLSGSDWTQLPDVPLATKAAWATYRQALRDITQQPGYPMDVSWPTPPA